MDTNKGIKILRIVSLTLGILSMLFFIYTKIAHAEETVVRTWANSTESMPLPFGSEYYGWIDFDATQYLEQRDIADNYIDLSEPYVTYYAFYSDIYYVLVWVQYADADHIFNVSGNWGGALTDIQLTHNQVVAYKTTYCDISSGTCGEFWFNNAPQAINFASMGTVSNGEYTLEKQSYNYFYPIGSNMQNLGNLDHTFFSTGFEEETIGEITDIFEETEIIAENSSETINDMTQGTYKNWFQAIIGTIWNSANNLVQNFKSFFAPFFNRVIVILNEIKEFFQTLIEEVGKITTLLTLLAMDGDNKDNEVAQQWITLYNASWIHELYLFFTGLKTQVQTIGQVEPNAPILTFEIPQNNLMNQKSTTINFGWYLNIKQIVQPLLASLMTISFAIFLIHQFPNLIHGVSSTGRSAERSTKE